MVTLTVGEHGVEFGWRVRVSCQEKFFWTESEPAQLERKGAGPAINDAKVRSPGFVHNGQAAVAAFSNWLTRIQSAAGISNLQINSFSACKNAQSIWHLFWRIVVAQGWLIEP